MKKHTAKTKQTSLFQPTQKAFGGDLMKKSKGRGARPISTRNTMHLVLRSTKAVKEWSFKLHHDLIVKIIKEFADKYGIKIISLANVGNHLHMQIKISNRHAYKKFIRAITSIIAVKITKTCRWNKMEGSFWDRRPFTRIITSFSEVLNLKDYIEVNRLEGQGYNRSFAYTMIKSNRVVKNGLAFNSG